MKTTSVREAIDELDIGSGFVIFRNISYENFLEISNNVGKLQPQNNKKEEVIVVKDRGIKMFDGGRYHQSNEGGSIHTDSPHWESVVDYVGLYCNNTSASGGESLLCSSADVYNTLKSINPSFIDILRECFYIDKKEYSVGESKTLFKPILFEKNNNPCLRYLRDYIESGYLLENKTLSEDQLLALNHLDKAIDMNIKKQKLHKFDAIIFNNLRMLHGRTSYTDDKQHTRELKRVWLCKH